MIVRRTTPRDVHAEGFVTLAAIPVHPFRAEEPVKAAIVNEVGKPPVYGDFRNPEPAAGKHVVRVTAAALTQLTKGRASGTHYTSDGSLPFVPGVDGVGVREDGKRVYFALPEKPFGAMGEQCLVDASHQFELPDGLDDVAAAAMANPGMSSWAALVERAHFGKGEAVLVNGATGAAGRMAIQIAKHLGASKVVATGRRTETFDELRELGADVTIPLTTDRGTLEAACKEQFRDGIDVVLDYLWGPSAETLITAIAKASPSRLPVRFVQIGSLGGATLAMPAAALRASGLVLMGSGFGSVSLEKLLRSIHGVMEAAPSAGFRVASRTMPLAEVAQAWNAQDADARIVLVP